MSPTKKFLLTLALTAMWSPSFLFIKLAIQDLPPMTIAASRITLAMLLLLTLLCWKGYFFPRNLQFWGHALVVGAFSTAIPFCLFCYAEQTIESSLAAIINGTTPMFTAVLAQFFIPSDRLNLSKIVGITLCASGLLYLFAPNIQGGMSGTTYGMLAAMAAAFSYSIQHIYTKKYFTGHKPFIAPTASLTCAAFMLWPCVFLMEDPLSLPMPSMSAMLGVCGLALFGTVIAFVLYYKLLEESGPTAISLVACFFPVGGLLLGMIFLGETFTLANFSAAILILLGLGVVNQVIPLKFLRPEKALSE